MYCTEIVGEARKIYEVLNIAILSEALNGIYLEDEIKYEDLRLMIPR